MNAEIPSLPVKPRVPRYFYVLPVAADRILFKTAGKMVSMRGQTVTTLLPRLLPLLDGQHTVAQIVSAVQGFDAKDITRALELMNAKGLLEDAAIEPPPELSEADRYVDQLTFFSHFTRDHHAAQLALQNARVAIIGLGAIGATVLNALARAGVGHIATVDGASVQSRDCGGSTVYHSGDLGRTRCEVAQERMKRFPTLDLQVSPHPVRDTRDVEHVIHDCDLAILCVEDGPGPLFRWVNQACLAQEIPWTSGYLDGSSGFLGPSVAPQQTPCYECYRLRMKGNLEHYEEFTAFEEYLEQQGAGSERSYGTLAPLPGLVAMLTALEAIKMLTRFSTPALYGRLYEIDFVTLRAQLHDILKLPRCPACGPARQAPLINPWGDPSME